ncbi:MAG: hypothetical protein FOGNACKC_02740 [Anaerolineae bacterium]|nr:hypothetical protein [Anaerolineae bacterium]
MTTPNTWYWKLWKYSVMLVGLYAMINLISDFFGFGLMPYSWPAFFYVMISWVILRFVFKRSSW